VFVRCIRHPAICYGSPASALHQHVMPSRVKRNGAGNGKNRHDSIFQKASKTGRQARSSIVVSNGRSGTGNTGREVVVNLASVRWWPSRVSWQPIIRLRAKPPYNALSASISTCDRHFWCRSYELGRNCNADLSLNPLPRGTKPGLTREFGTRGKGELL
jgi:hypothetical protein